MNIHKFVLLLLAMLAVSPVTSWGQFQHDARTMGMGGIGVASTSGTAAVRHNPANLMIFERPQRWSLVASQFGYAFSSGIQPENLTEIHRYLRPLHTGMPREAFPYNRSRQELLENRFAPDDRSYTSIQNLDALLFGLSYTGNTLAVALTHYLRGDNSFETGRGWYSEQPLRTDNLLVTDRRFNQRFNLRHEIGISMASEYDLISGWLSDLSKIYIGIHGKLILPLAYANTSLHSVYATSEGDDVTTHTGSFSSRTAGNISQTYSEGGLSLYNPANLTDISGIGGGFDFGVTYIIGFGNDVSLTTRNKIPARYSIRLSASLTDIGFISYSSDLRRAVTAEQRQVLANPSVSNPPLETEFTGNPADIYRFITSETERRLLDDATVSNPGTFRVLLPARITTGAAVQLNRLMFGAEIQHPIQSLTDQIQHTSFHLGGELRLLTTIPLRAGMQLERGQPIRYHAGTGLDFRALTFSVAVVAQSTGQNEAFLPVLASFSGLHIRF